MIDFSYVVRCGISYVISSNVHVTCNKHQQIRDLFSLPVIHLWNKAFSVVSTHDIIWWRNNHSFLWRNLFTEWSWCFHICDSLLSLSSLKEIVTIKWGKVFFLTLMLNLGNSGSMDNGWSLAVMLKRSSLGFQVAGIVMMHGVCPCTSQCSFQYSGEISKVQLTI